MPFPNSTWTGKTIDDRFKHPSEVELLVGDASKAKEKLGWEPEIRFKELVVEMVRADYERLIREGK